MGGKPGASCSDPCVTAALIGLPAPHGAASPSCCLLLPLGKSKRRERASPAAAAAAACALGSAPRRSAEEPRGCTGSSQGGGPRLLPAVCLLRVSPARSVPRLSELGELRSGTRRLPSARAQRGWAAASRAALPSLSSPPLLTAGRGAAKFHTRAHVATGKERIPAVPRSPGTPPRHGRAGDAGPGSAPLGVSGAEAGAGAGQGQEWGGGAGSQKLDCVSLQRESGGTYGGSGGGKSPTFPSGAGESVLAGLGGGRWFY